MTKESPKAPIEEARLNNKTVVQIYLQVLLKRKKNHNQLRSYNKIIQINLMRNLMNNKLKDSK